MSENIHQELSLRTTSPAALQTSRYLNQLSENFFQGLKKTPQSPKTQENCAYRALSSAFTHPSGGSRTPQPCTAPGERGPAVPCYWPSAEPGDFVRAVILSQGGRGASARAIAQGTRCTTTVTL